MKKALVLLALALPAVAHAQDAAAPPADPGVGAARTTWQIMTRYVTMAAEELSEADYAYKPVDSVRSFGQLVGHVAGAQYMFCAAALGEAPRAENEVESTATTKAALVAALKASTEYCGRAYQQTDAAAAGSTQLFGGNVTRMFALVLNASHNGEHYGNIVTYMRMKGMVPPSSRQQGGGN
ncbi:MAG TPA: DinB family protein [Longimicrobiaceae bacterium]|nr:DinB family protein [Longimicrobiaceae bacterium]